MTVTVVVGNPKPRSRTLRVAESVAHRLTGSAPDAQIDLVDLGAELLKLFLDRFGTDELVGVTGVAVMLGGDLRHSLAPELLLKPVLVEIGLTLPTRGLFVVDSAVDDPTSLEHWATVATRQVAAVSGKLR